MDGIGRAFARKSCWIYLRMIMKNQFLKSVVVLGTVLTLISCSDEATNAVNNFDPNALGPVPESNTSISYPAPSADEACWPVDADQTYLVYPTGVVTNLNGQVVGTVTFVEGTLIGTITRIDGTPILEYVDVTNITPTTLSLIIAAATSSAADPTFSSEAAPTLSSAALPTLSSSSTLFPASSETIVATSSSSEKASSSSTAPIVDGKLTITGSLTQTVAKNAKTSEIKFSGVENVTRLSWNAWWLEEPKQGDGTYTIPASTVPEHFQPEDGNTVSEFFKVNGKDYEFKITISGAAQQEKSSSSTAKSSSSVKSSSSTAKSSSSVRSSSSAKSSSSVQSSSSVASSSSKEVVTTGCPNIKVKGGASGTGFASRYWDGCKPSCSWTANAGSAGPAKQCSANGKTENTDYNAQSVCNGGGAAACTSQIPFTIDGCDNIGFAFAAVPASNGGQCGKCFQLTFTGKGEYENKANQKALAGKKLIIMVTNVGTDVKQGQFDIMIPGGGVGLFNGTSGYGWGSQGKQYGGLLSDCETEVGYNASNLLEKRKSCLTEKCNKAFASDATAKQGCLFLANFMEAAGNPKHEYTEVECPDVLKNKY